MSTLILLAAGRSQRFGRDDKLLANAGGRPLAVRTASRIGGGWHGDRVAVTSSARVAALLQPLGWRCIANPAPERGQASSLVIGVEASDPDSALVIALADMPGVSAAHVEAIRERTDTDGAAMSCTPDGTLLPPAGFAPRWRKALLALSGDRGAKNVFLQTKGATVELARRDAFDVDVPEDMP